MIIDSHVHIGEGIDLLCYNPKVPDLIKRMDKLGIKYLINAPYDGMQLPTFELGAEDSIRLYKETEGRILNYFNYDPRYVERCCKMIEEHHDNPAFVGIKIHPSKHHTFADNENYRPAWELAKKYGFTIMSHTWALSAYNPNQKFATPDLFEKWIREYPEVNFIFGHSGGRTQGVRDAAALAKKYDNAYLDIAGDPYEIEYVNYLVNTAGDGKVLFGSDVFWFDPSGQLGMVLGAAVSNEEKENILKNTALKVFKKMPRE